MKNNSISSALSSEAHATVSAFLRDFKRSGIHLPDEQRSQFVSLSDDIIVLGRQFLQPDSLPSQRLVLRLSELEGLPSQTLRALRAQSTFTGKVTIRPHTAEAASILKYARREDVRRRVWELAPSSGEKVEVLDSLLRKRSELAALVGSPSYGDMALSDMMAGSPGPFL
jgi:intermediate peptidase